MRGAGHAHICARGWRADGNRLLLQLLLLPLLIVCLLAMSWMRQGAATTLVAVNLGGNHTHDSRCSA